MNSPRPSPETPSDGVRTPDALRCPGPGCTRVLKPTQTTCSGRCRAAVWRAQRTGQHRAVADLLRDVRRQAEDVARRITEAIGE